MKKYLLLLILLILGCRSIAFAADWMRSGNAELTLENEPTIGGISIIKIKAKVYGDIPNEAISKARIYCSIPDGLEFINDKNYKIERRQDDAKNWFNFIVLYEGPMNKNEVKEVLFKVKVPDAKKYTISGGVTGSGDQRLEIDLGEPEPPEWKPVLKERIFTRNGKKYILRDVDFKEGKRIEDLVEIKENVIGKLPEAEEYVLTNIKQIKDSDVADLIILEDASPPFRTELRIRTKDKPYIEYWRFQPSPEEPFLTIPLRYLIYTEEETKEAEVTVELPEGLELINDQNYKVATQKKEGQKFTIVKLFQGPMRFKECKAFYFKVRSDKKERFRVKAQTKILTYDEKEFMTEDYWDIELGRVLY